MQVKNALFERLHKTAAERIAALPADLGPKELMQLVIDELLKDETDPCRILAELPAKVYVSASASPLIERVLETQGKTPIVLVSEWRDERRTEQVFHGDTKPERPYVYYVYGDIRDENTWVLTEDNFFDYLIRTSLYHELMPPVISKALTQSCLLFLGFRLDDWTFRILFRMIMAKGGSANLDTFNHVGVQVDPDEHTLADAERAKDYLQRYFVNAKIDIYWGSAADFLRELNKTLKKRKQTQSQKPAAPVQARGEW